MHKKNAHFCVAGQAREEEVANKLKDMEVLRKSKQLPRGDQVTDIHTQLEKVTSLWSILYDLVYSWHDMRSCTSFKTIRSKSGPAGFC